ncbi:phosphatidate cytidylyltransferase [Marinirhabdus gelatinilytica]|uniref:Phosphatidate cytidylyltransferase n=1 Tax=Marinirhabdus gelatinilytica TaxID=1703343 RepID=A0A370Q8J3_9FLAO|nr:phosphatidate cytidylyltransferase [Marinirhabdus gelatinilytica]RDK84688.1 phosphatidate cytidylyltransferase [Marinirhabdus gelatinilytica]
MKELIVRTISGLLYAAIIIFSMYTTHEWLMALFLILAGITLTEFLRLVHLKSYISYALLLVFMYFFSYDVFDQNAIYLYLILTCFVNLFLLKDVLWTTKIPMFEKKKYITVIFYVISGFVFLTLIPFQQNEFYPKLIIGVFLLIWGNDSAAYLVGKNFGKRKLLERISPKKTVEGFLGGIAGSMLAAFIIFNYSEIYDLWVWICLGILASLFGTIGDLIQSKFKRQAGVKDSGTLMPGHGGLYDRLDSIMYASPFLYAFLLIVDYVS